MRAAVILALTLASATARGDGFRYGGEVSVRSTTLAGQLKAESEAKPAVAVVARRELSSSWALVLEPGLRWSGSVEHGLVYAGVPVLGQFGYQLLSNMRLRVSAGPVPAILVIARRYAESSDGPETHDITDGMRRWDFGMLVGVGLEWNENGKKFFVEARAMRGLVTIDGGPDPIFLVDEEIGVWAGVSQ